jgi:hypothetical protein
MSIYQWFCIFLLVQIVLLEPGNYINRGRKKMEATGRFIAIVLMKIMGRPG